MYRIGDFSRLTRVSVKMLRHYDELGLLRPACVDPSSSYRYYSAAQLSRLNRLIALKDLGFSLEQIAVLLDGELSSEELHGMLRLREAETTERIRQERRRLVQLRAHMLQIDQDAPRHDVVLRAVPAILVASIRQIVPDLDAAATRLFDTLEMSVATRRARAPASPLLFYHDAEYRETQVDVEAAVPITAPFPAADLMVHELPAVGAMACVVYVGGYEHLTGALNTLLRWIDANGYAIDGPLREVYLRFGTDRAVEFSLPAMFLTDRPDEFVTELQLPVKPIGGSY